MTIIEKIKNRYYAQYQRIAAYEAILTILAIELKVRKSITLEDFNKMLELIK